MENRVDVTPGDFTLKPVGVVRSALKSRADAPRQGNEGAGDAWVDFQPFLAEALMSVRAGDEMILITWFHESRRDVLQVHPRSDETQPLTGVFSTRSPERPNPIGLHRVRVMEIHNTSLRVAPLEAIHGTPVIDLKPVLDQTQDY